jgi:dihydropteroate synthase
LAELQALGFPVLIGASRKRFLPTSGHPAGSAADLAARDLSTAVITALVAAQGVWGVRVHDAASSARAAEVVTAINESGSGAP